MTRLIEFIAAKCVSLTFRKTAEEKTISMTLADESGTRSSLFCSRTILQERVTEDYVLSTAYTMLRELDDGDNVGRNSILNDAEAAWRAYSSASIDGIGPDLPEASVMRRSGFLHAVLAISNRLYEKAIGALQLQHQTTDVTPVFTSRFNSPGVSVIASERRRQVEEEYFNHVHDDRYTGGELLSAAGAYLADSHAGCLQLSGIWPWSDASYKPGKTTFRKLVMAGALVAAELDRRIRCNDIST